MSNGFYIGRKTNPLVACRCCWKPKERDGQKICSKCIAAGCRFDCGWKRGKAKDENGWPLCPALLRARRNGLGVKKKD